MKCKSCGNELAKGDFAFSYKKTSFIGDLLPSIELELVRLSGEETGDYFCFPEKSEEHTVLRNRYITSLYNGSL